MNGCRNSETVKSREPETMAKRRKLSTDAARDEAGSHGNGKGKEVAPAAEPEPQPPKDYIHVRARRGQATDSHSLAERVRVRRRRTPFLRSNSFFSKKKKRKH
jgi:hypothetical protein